MKKHIFNIFPEMIQEDYQRLKSDIQQNGYDARNPVWLYDGEILDGWHRQKACDEIGKIPVYKDFIGSDQEAISFVMRTNRRRNLTSSQWACIATEAEELITGIKEKVEQERREKQAETQKSGAKVQLIVPQVKDTSKLASTKVSELFNTNRTYISDAAKLKETKPEVFEQVKRGEKTFTEVKREEKKEYQKERFEALEIKELDPISKKYDVIVIDPPWKMEKIAREVAPLQVGFDYPTMEIEEIKNFVLPSEDNCHVFLWITHKHLPEGFEILKAWGAKYVCCFVWHKNGGFQPWGLPQYNCEFVLYGRIGTPEFFDTKDFNVCFNADRTGHSKKPEEFYNTVRRVTAGNRIDIFNRREIEGFDKWGNESDD